jgi:hypothetical protein
LIKHAELLKTLKARFEKNMNRHEGLDWTKIQAKLEANPKKLLDEMERTEGGSRFSVHRRARLL